MIKLENLYKNIGDFKIEDISFELDKGYIMALIGPNGSGKTTLIKMLLGLIKADKGEIKLFDKNISEDEIYVKDNIGFVFDSLNFYPNLRVKDFKKIVGEAYSRFNSKVFDDYIKKFNINPKAYIGNLSKGEAMKIMMANALSHDAKLLILDEPTAGLDPIVRKELLSILQEEIVSGDKSVIISTHIISDIYDIADYVTFINKGKLVFSKDMEEIKDKYRIFRASREEIERSNKKFIWVKEKKYYCEALFIDEAGIEDEKTYIPSLEEIIYYYVKGEEQWLKSLILDYLIFDVFKIIGVRKIVLQDIQINIVASLLSMSAIMPLIFKLGYSKLRLLYPVITFFIGYLVYKNDSITNLINYGKESLLMQISHKLGTLLYRFFSFNNYDFTNISINIYLIITAFLSAIIFIISMYLSLRVYKNKDII